MGRAIVREPAAFLFDEPLSNLDAKLRVQMRLEIQKLHRELSTTSIFVTHDQVEAMTLADRMIVMNAGVVEQIGAPIEVYDEPGSLFVAGFIGSPAMNFLPAKIDGRKLLLGVRPEHLEPCAASEAKLVARGRPGRAARAPIRSPTATVRTARASSPGCTRRSTPSKARCRYASIRRTGTTSTRNPARA